MRKAHGKESCSTLVEIVEEIYRSDLYPIGKFLYLVTCSKDSRFAAKDTR